MTTMTRSAMTRSAMTRTATVLGMVNGLGARFNGFDANRPATALPPGAIPSRGYPEVDPSQHQPACDCQSPRLERTRSIAVAKWRPTDAAKPATAN